VTTSLWLFLAFVAVTLIVTFYASRRTKTASDFYSAGRSISGIQNGWALAGDYISAASFLGISGLIAFYGYDGFMYCVGFLVAYLTVLMLVAEPLRNTGKYTMADVLAFRLRSKSVRGIAALSTLAVSLFYMVAQMVGAGSLVKVLIPAFTFDTSIILVGAIMLVYVIVGGMLATTWVQIIKAVLMMVGVIILSLFVLAHYNFSIGDFVSAVANVHGTVKNAAGEVVATKSYLEPGLLYNGQWGALNLLSLGIALVFGTAGLPHILIRFYTVPTAQAARKSVVWATTIIGAFYLMTMLLGFGAAAILGKAQIGVHVTGPKAAAFIAAHPLEATKLTEQLNKFGYIVPAPNNNLASVVLAGNLGGDVLLSFVSAIAFATILAVVAGLTIAASSTIAHDFWINIVREGKERPGEEVRVARIAAVGIGVLSIVLAVALQSLNVAFLVGLAFAVAASANVPAIILTLFWKRFNTTGTIVGMVVGLVSSLVLIAVSPAIMGVDEATVTVRHLIQAKALFPLENPGIISVPLGFIAAVIAALATQDRRTDATFAQLTVRANTGLGAEA